MEPYEFGKWLGERIYVPIIVGIAVIIIVVLVTWLCCKKCRRSYCHGYTHLAGDMTHSQRMESQRQHQQNILRDSSWMSCQFYLRSNPQYGTVQHLDDIGSRANKQWFCVTDNLLNCNRLLSIVPPDDRMVLPFIAVTKNSLRDLFAILQHPYIFPMTEIDFFVEQNLIVVVQPISERGSLKDFIYQTKCMDNWQKKYNYKSRGLPDQKVQLFGKQILMALLYLEEKGFPSHGHIHCGNVMLQNNICRLSGYENVFLGYTSRVHQLVKKKLKDNKEAINTLCFGHMLFEMLFGYELDSPHPEPRHLAACQNAGIIQLLNFIFYNEKNYPSIREISEHDFFRSIHLQELHMYSPTQITMTSAMKNLLKSVKKGKRKRSASSRKITINETTKPKSRRKVSDSRPPDKGSVPPPPPPDVPSPPTPPPEYELVVSENTGGRAALLRDICYGAQLRKAKVDDRL